MSSSLGRSSKADLVLRGCIEAVWAWRMGCCIIMLIIHHSRGRLPRSGRDTPYWRKTLCIIGRMEAHGGEWRYTLRWEGAVNAARTERYWTWRSSWFRVTICLEWLAYSVVFSPYQQEKWLTKGGSPQRSPPCLSNNNFHFSKNHGATFQLPTSHGCPLPLPPLEPKQSNPPSRMSPLSSNMLTKCGAAAESIIALDLKFGIGTRSNSGWCGIRICGRVGRRFAGTRGYDAETSDRSFWGSVEEAAWR